MSNIAVVHVPPTHAVEPEKGINRGVVEQIASWTGEPAWMTETRLRSLDFIDEKPTAEWFAADMPDIDFQDIVDDLRPKRERVTERQDRAGVTARHESEVVDRKQRSDLKEQGVLFCDMETAVRDHPQLVKEYFGTIIPPGDNQFAALNTSVWSGGSFVYVPPGVDVEMPLQAFSRSNSESPGQFERTLIIADEGSNVHYFEGYSAPVYTKDSLRAAVVEIVVKPNARVSYTSIQNWSSNVCNFVTQRARVEAGGHMKWVNGNIGSKLTMTYPAVYLAGEGATGEVLSVAYASKGQQQETGAHMVHAASNTTSRIISKLISQDGGTTTYRGLVRVEEGATGTTSHSECDALILDERSFSNTFPDTEIGARDAQIDHEASVSKIADAQLFYLMSRGLSTEQATGMIVNGFIEPVTKTLPLEYAVEWSRLIELQMEGSVG